MSPSNHCWGCILIHFYVVKPLQFIWSSVTDLQISCSDLRIITTRMTCPNVGTCNRRIICLCGAKFCHGAWEGKICLNQYVWAMEYTMWTRYYHACRCCAFVSHFIQHEAVNWENSIKIHVPPTLISFRFNVLAFLYPWSIVFWLATMKCAVTLFFSAMIKKTCPIDL